MARRSRSAAALCLFLHAAVAAPTAAAQTTALIGSLDSSARIRGRVTDATGLVLSNVTVEARGDGIERTATTDGGGVYDIAVPARDYRLSFRLPGFAASVQSVAIDAGTVREVNVTLQLMLSSDVLVTAKKTFRNLADVDPAGGDLVGIAAAASEGVVSGAQLDERPVYRVGEVLEAVPGVVISQHSGEGKANQYYVRGFNIDHGTDLATTVAGIPVNLPTHAHGQGYTDVSFLIPELVSGVQYRKGPYYADEGDFSSAAAIHVTYVNSLDRPVAVLETGHGRHGRVLLAGSRTVGSGHVLFASEGLHHDGPWLNPDGFRKLNGVLRYSRGTAQDGFSVTALAYDGRWTATDQVPRRALENGSLARYGTLDPTTGGESRRLALAAEWRHSSARGRTDFDAFGIQYRLNLFSNFTYFLHDPDNGDQFEQEDRRIVGGLRASHRWLARLGAREVENLAGLQLRNDHIPTVALYHTRERRRLGVVRSDRVEQRSASAFAQSSVQWNPWLRTTAGLRSDVYRFDVDGREPAHSGRAAAAHVSPKLSAVLRPWKQTEIYLNFGGGFHSNDGRTATITRPLVRTRGGELGVRTTAIRGLHSALAAWGLDIGSELLFVGDAGTTEPGRPSRRMGFEWANYVKVRRWLALDADVAWSRARFRDEDAAGNRIPGAVEGVASVGLTVQDVQKLSGSVRLRYFGPRPLIEDDNVRSRAATVLSARVGYRLSSRYSLGLEAFNPLNATVSDIDYYYASRLPGEPAEGVDDVHTHPLEPRALRASLNVLF